MNKIIIYNKANIINSLAVELASKILQKENELRKEGDCISITFEGLIIKGEILKRKNGYTIVIS